MLKNYLKVGVRNLLKHKWYTLIHVLGLAIGLAAFLLIDQYIGFEKSYDKFHTNSDQIYRLTTDNIVDGKIQVRDAMSFAPSGAALMNDLPEVLSYTTTLKTNSVVFRKGAEVVEEKGLLAVDSSFLRLFHYPLVSGNAEDLLSKPNTIVLTQSMAEKYFGSEDPIGQSMEMLTGSNTELEVVGLLEDTPENTHYKFDMLFSLKSVQEQIQQDGWNGYNYYTYLLLDKQADLAALNERLPALSRKYLGEESKLVFNLQPVESIHLHSDFTFEPEVHGSAKAVGFLSIISLFILIIAWVNYTNLSTARALERAKEVGLRKVVGARKKQLIGQFLTESLLINFLGAIAAVLLAKILLPYFNDLVGKEILATIWGNQDFLLKLGGFFLLGTFLAGAYPAVLLSSFKPIGILRGRFSHSKRGVFLRKALVVMQFTASLILIAGTMIIYQQINYMTGKDLGMQIDQTIGIKNPSFDSDREAEFASKYEAFSNELLRLDGVESLAGISSLPGGGSSNISSSSGGVRIVGNTDRVEATVYINRMDDRLLDALSIELEAGRNFDREIAADTNGIIVNEALLGLLGISDPESVINQKLQFGRNEDNTQFPIVGVINNFNRTTLKNQVEPTVFFYSPLTRSMVLKLSDETIGSTLAQLEGTWDRFFPNAPLSYEFLDQRFEQLYIEEKRFGQLFANFSILAIIVATLGLFGLAAFLSNQRTKEVGVRKVLGASVSSIIVLFFKDYLWLILLAVVIGMPLIFVGMNEWLNNYHYRISFPWLSLILAAVLLFSFAFLTVGYQTYRVAILNPARTIKDE
ncbi:ABC transporter permease [Flavilitoribacter nigricans]|uniref:ABC transporter permease n=1 Tax=Flavilitoribacter nigricans (strain ATCC 23147 / DSM 23189 / NBRC 102662 / NCIMB 1420 / SS-2) TaxID=1122177 RepID=A0A2D0ND39_FLAN2|nr:ABC transporter permease [Flavilitoribacter nigricans]PHN06405.1 ABC transporter permease [Flavilitoribacter nigricans DSM 23189 = NBRC 102662]